MRNEVVFIVILNYKNWEDTVECIEAVSLSRYTKFKLLLVDNNSRNESVREIIKYLEKSRLAKRVDYSLSLLEKDDSPLVFRNDLITIIKSDKNGGFAYGNNLALDFLKEEDGYIFLLNPDMMVEPNTIEYLVQEQSKIKYKNVSTCMIYNYHDKSKFLYSGLVRLNSKTATVKELKVASENADYVCGGALFTKTTTFEEVGLLPEDYFLYWEDADWCYQAKNKGYQLKSCKAAVAYDKGGTTIGRGYLAEYYYVRNGLIFFNKIASFPWTIVFLNLTLRVVKKIMKLQFGRAKAVIDGTFDFLFKK